MAHHIKKSVVEVEKVKVKVIKYVPLPTIIKQCRGFLKCDSFYMRFIKDFDTIS